MKTTFLYSLISLSLCQQWTQILPASFTMPEARLYHSFTWTCQGWIVYGGHDFNIVWGGRTFHIILTVAFNDMWSFDTLSSSWASVASSTGPSGRYFHTSVKIANDEILYLGGRATSGVSTNELWIFSPQRSTWFTRAPSPYPMFGHSAVFDLLGNQMIVYYYGNLYSYSVSCNVWTTITQGTLIPPARSFQTASIKTETREMFMFGGYNDLSHLNDIWKFQIYNDMLSSTISTVTQSFASSGFLALASQSSNLHTGISSAYSTPDFQLSSSWTAQSHPSRIESPTFNFQLSAPSSQGQLTPGSDSAVSTTPSMHEGESLIELLAVFSTSYLSRSSSKRPLNPFANSTQNLFTAKTISILTAICICVVLMIICLVYFCTRNKKKSTARDLRKPKKSQGTLYGSTDDTWATQTSVSTYSGTNGTTTISSNYGLAIPGYLLIKYGYNVRSKKEIARGGFGRIMLGEVLDMATIPSSTPVIIKEMIGQVSKKEIDSFYQEVSIMAYLGKQKNIATLYGYTEQPYTIVMKYYPIGSLDGWIYSKKTRKTVSQIFYFALDIAQGVEFMWTKGFCHSDLKPQNVLIDLDTSTDIATCVLTDFGITQIFSDKSLLVQAFQPVNINGASIMYAAPEAILKLRRKEHVPPQLLPKFDIYSYAVVLYELVCRMKPF